MDFLSNLRDNITFHIIMIYILICIFIVPIINKFENDLVRKISKKKMEQIKEFLVMTPITVLIIFILYIYFTM